MDYDEEKLLALEKLCKIQLDSDEKTLLHQNLRSILLHIEKLQELDTTHIEPLTFVHAGETAVLRDDEPEQLMDRDTFLSMAPEQIGGMIKVPTVIKDEL